MRILLDTNIIIDILAKRKEFHEDSFKAVDKALKNDDMCYLSASAVTDVYYALRKQFNHKERLSLISELLEMVKIAEVNEECILDALTYDINDYEDAVVQSVAKNISADLILTRNAKDFKNCKIKVMDPKEFVYEN